MEKKPESIRKTGLHLLGATSGSVRGWMFLAWVPIARQHAKKQQGILGEKVEGKQSEG